MVDTLIVELQCLHYSQCKIKWEYALEIDYNWPNFQLRTTFYLGVGILYKLCPICIQNVLYVTEWPFFAPRTLLHP